MRYDPILVAESTYIGMDFRYPRGRSYIRGLKSEGKKGRIRPCRYGIMSGAWREAVLLLSEV